MENLNKIWLFKGFKAHLSFLSSLITSTKKAHSSFGPSPHFSKDNIIIKIIKVKLRCINIFISLYSTPFKTFNLFIKSINFNFILQVNSYKTSLNN